MRRPWVHAVAAAATLIAAQGAAGSVDSLCTGIGGEFCEDVCCYAPSGLIAYCCPVGTSCCGTSEHTNKGLCCADKATCVMDCMSMNVSCVLGDAPTSWSRVPSGGGWVVPRAWKHNHQPDLHPAPVKALATADLADWFATESRRDKQRVSQKVIDATICNLSKGKQCCEDQCCDVCCAGVCAPKGYTCCDQAPTKSCPPETPQCCPVAPVDAKAGGVAARAAHLKFLDAMFGRNGSGAGGGSHVPPVVSNVCCNEGAQCCTDGSCGADGVCCGGCNCCDTKTEFCSGTVCEKIPSDISTPVLLMLWAVVFFSNIALLMWRWFESDKLAQENPRVCLYCGHGRHCNAECTDQQLNQSDDCVSCARHCQRKDCHRARSCGKNYSRSQRIAKHHATSETVSIKVVNLPCPCTECLCRQCVPRLDCPCKACMCVDCQSFTKTLTYYLSFGSSILCLGLSVTAHYLCGYRSITIFYVVLTILWIVFVSVRLVAGWLGGGSGAWSWCWGSSGIDGEAAAPRRSDLSSNPAERVPDSRSPQRLQDARSPAGWS